jgi:hypothetical protein
LNLDLHVGVELQLHFGEGNTPLWTAGIEIAAYTGREFFPPINLIYQKRNPAVGYASEERISCE